MTDPAVQQTTQTTGQSALDIQRIQYGENL